MFPLRRRITAAIGQQTLGPLKLLAFALLCLYPFAYMAGKSVAEIFVVLTVLLLAFAAGRAWLENKGGQKNGWQHNLTSGHFGGRFGLYSLLILLVLFALLLMSAILSPYNNKGLELALTWIRWPLLFALVVTAFSQGKQDQSSSADLLLKSLGIVAVTCPVFQGHL